MFTHTRLVLVLVVVTKHIHRAFADDAGNCQGNEGNSCNVDLAASVGTNLLQRGHSGGSAPTAKLSSSIDQTETFSLTSMDSTVGEDGDPAMLERGGKGRKGRKRRKRRSPAPTPDPTPGSTPAPTADPTATPTIEPTPSPTRSPTENPTPSFITELNLPKNCAGRAAQTSFPYGGGTIFPMDVIAPSDYSTYQDDLEDNGRGQESYCFDRRSNMFHTWTDAIRFKCTFKYFHEDTGPTVYTLRIRANPSDFSDHRDVRNYLTPFLKSLGRLPEILWQNLESMTFHKHDSAWGGNQWLGDILVYTDSYLSWMGETFFHEGAHCSLDPIVSEQKWLTAIQDDCDEYYSSYARDYPSREGPAESFLVYYAARYKRHTLTSTQLEDAFSIGPNRLKLFEELVPREMSQPPLNPDAALVSSSSKKNQDLPVKYVHTEDPNIVLSPEELEEARRTYIIDQGYLEGR